MIIGCRHAMTKNPVMLGYVTRIRVAFKVDGFDMPSRGIRYDIMPLTFPFHRRWHRMALASQIRVP